MPPPRAHPAREGLAYVALGDSYTIGTAVAQAERWPDQLVARLGPGRLRLVANLGVNGYTSADVIEFELPRLASFRPAFASLLVGVNDLVQGITLETFGTNAGTILGALLELLPPRRIVVVSIPDYTLTPQGSQFGDPAVRRTAIIAANGRLEDLARGHGIGFVDILDLSQHVPNEPSLVAWDGLHPSGAQYRRWVDRIAPVVERLLQN